MKSIKKIVLLAFMALFCAGAANAQFRFGVKAGLNVDKLHFNEKVFDSDNNCGFTAGVMTEFQIPIIGLCFDLSAMYTRMNSNLEYASPVVNGVADVSKNKNFLEIPLNVKYKFQIPVVASIIKPYVFTGPSFAIKLDKNTVNALKTKTCQTVWNIGLGVELIKHLQLGASYGFGINNIIDKTTDINVVDYDVKNNYWTITLAYLF